MRKLTGFTLAEVLITLGVIGVVAAMTMPVLINRIKDKQYDRAREKALMSIGEAGRLLAIQGDIGAGTDAEDFVKNYLSKKLKIAKTCDSNHLSDCGLPETIKKLGATDTMSMPNTFAGLGIPSPESGSNYYTIRDNTNYNYGFLTANGFAVNLFYNPNCTTDTNEENKLAPDYVCMNAVYDMNGKRNPNQVGKDIGFVTVLYPNETNRAVAPNPTATETKGNFTWENGNAVCGNGDEAFSSGVSMSPLGVGYSLPDKDELLSMAINCNLIGITSYSYLSSSVLPPFIWTQIFHSGGRIKNMGTHNVRCVRR